MSKFEGMSHQESVLDTLKSRVSEFQVNDKNAQEVFRSLAEMYEKKEMSPQLEKAIDIALHAHEGQKDKGGVSYILHPLRLLAQMETNEEKIVAALHDVVEDSNYTLNDLRDAGFSEKVIESVDMLTRKEADTYDEFINKIIPHPLARRVKLADLHDNVRLDRISQPTKEDLGRHIKYKRAIYLLEKEQ